jgi:hypothetical protein
MRRTGLHTFHPSNFAPNTVYANKQTLARAKKRDRG